MAKEAKKFSTVPLNWKEVWYTNCPLVSASNVDQELGPIRGQFAANSGDTILNY